MNRDHCWENISASKIRFLTKCSFSRSKYNNDISYLQKVPLGRSHSWNSFNESQSFVKSQCDQIGKNFANWAKFFSIRQFLFKEKIAQWFEQNFSWIKLVGGLLGPFLWSLGDFFTKTSGHTDFRWKTDLGWKSSDYETRLFISKSWS
jgi:hypothetical protein